MELRHHRHWAVEARLNSYRYSLWYPIYLYVISFQALNFRLGNTEEPTGTEIRVECCLLHTDKEMFIIILHIDVWSTWDFLWFSQITVTAGYKAFELWEASVSQGKCAFYSSVLLFNWIGIRQFRQLCRPQLFHYMITQ